jgi:hypothetical protein
MTAAEWLAEARASGIAVYLDPRPQRAESGFIMSWPVLMPDEVLSRYAPEQWPGIDEKLAIIGHRAVHAELMKAREALPTVAKGRWKSATIP